MDLATRRVVATLPTLDTPADVVFAGDPVRAFVSCALPNTVQVFDPETRQALARVAIDGDRPKTLAVSPDGHTVYAAIFESGNGSTVLGRPITDAFTFPPPAQNPVDNANGPDRGENPPPNRGTQFSPPIRTNFPPRLPPPVAHIVKKTDAGRWLDDNAADWTEFISGTNARLSNRTMGWDLPDRDLAIIDTATLE